MFAGPEGVRDRVDVRLVTAVVSWTGVVSPVRKGLHRIPECRARAEIRSLQARSRGPLRAARLGTFRPSG
jgi:hypothetical protein